MPRVQRKRYFIDMLLGDKKEDYYDPPNWDDDDPRLGIYGPGGKLVSVSIPREDKPDSKDSKK